MSNSRIVLGDVSLAHIGPEIVSEIQSVSRELDGRGQITILHLSRGYQSSPFPAAIDQTSV